MSIVKSFTRTGGSYGQLASYIARDGAVLKGRDGRPFIFRHNALGTLPEEIAREFQENEKNRLRQRSNGITLYHEIISYRLDDSQKLTAEQLDKICRRYVLLRNENALYYGAAHTDREHTHLHLMISATEAFSGKSIRITKKEFQSIKNELQSYELELGLGRSAVEHNKGSKILADREHQLKVRTGKMSRKDEIRVILEDSFAKATGRDEFYENLRNGGLKLYERGGRVAGIDDNRRYRFSTLEFEEERMKELDVREERTADIDALRGRSSEERDIGRLEELERENMEERETDERLTMGHDGREAK